jgi:hypothetical protein
MGFILLCILNYIYALPLVVTEQFSKVCYVSPCICESLLICKVVALYSQQKPIYAR